MSESVKENDWSLAESSFTFGNGYKFILCCQQRGIMWRPAEDSLVVVLSCPLAQAGSFSFWLSAVCSGPLQCSCPLWHCSGSGQGLFSISLRKIKNTSKSGLSEAYVGTVWREKAGNTCWDLIGLIPHTIIL